MTQDGGLEPKLFLQDDVDVWVQSAAHGELLGFVTALQAAVVGLPNDAPAAVSEPVAAVLEILEKVAGTVERHPVAAGAVSRFGKPEFRDFVDDVRALGPEWMALLKSRAASSPLVALFLEVYGYFGECWGSRTRIDYGLGHELNFVLFLWCLAKLGVLNEKDYPACGLKVFPKYMAVMRTLQRVYWLEPAGSHGVWGLDDYHFMPFLLGAAQLQTHPHMKPKLVHNHELVATYWRQYMYLECIHFVNEIKTVPGKDSEHLSLRWHSPMLDDILAAKLWAKIAEGMVKMFKAEVLQKLPIVQHLLFGKLFEAPPNVPLHGPSDCGHAHEVNTWGDCCGIKVPSAVAASQMRVPFD